MSRNAFNELERDYDAAIHYRQQVAHEREQPPCRCSAYSFPHRKDSKACRELYNSELNAWYEPDSIESLGLRSLFEPIWNPKL